MNRSSSSPSPEEEAQLLEQLRQVLLSEDREALAAIRAILEDEAQLSEKVSPIIRQHLSFLKENFREEYGAIIQEIVTEKLSDSQDEIVNMIYPRLNTIIKKFITAQFQILKEGIDTQVKTVQNRFSPKNIFNRFFGPSESEIVLSQLDHPEIHEIYLVQRESGLLLGSYARETNTDQDVIAGMLTAIKSFAEDAFNRGKEDLEMIQYENYKIFLQNLPSYYFAVAMTGSISTSEKENLSNKLTIFAQDNVPFDTTDVNSTLTDRISAALGKHFDHFNIQQQ